MTREEYRAHIRHQLLTGKAMTYFRWYIETGEHHSADPAGEGWVSTLEVNGVNIGRVPTPPGWVPPPYSDFEDDDSGSTLRERTIIGPLIPHRYPAAT